MRVVLISDAHVDGLDDPVQQRLLGFLDRLEADRLVLLGDVFHRFWALPEVFPAYVPLIEGLRRVARRGVVVDFVLGNHDFSFEPELAAQLGLRTCERLETEVDGLRLFACHGDQATSSRRYRAYHAFLRGRLFDLGLRLAGPTHAWNLLGRLAGATEQDGTFPESLLRAQRAFARARLGEGFDLVVMGHSHLPESNDWPEGRYVNAGSFRDPGSWVEIIDGEVRLHRGG